MWGCSPRALRSNSVWSIFLPLISLMNDRNGNPSYGTSLPVTSEVPSTNPPTVGSTAMVPAVASGLASVSQMEEVTAISTSNTQSFSGFVPWKKLIRPVRASKYPMTLVIKDGETHPYEIRRESEHPFGMGGFGDVWEGERYNGGSPKPVALKSPRLIWSDEPERYKKKFYREVNIWSSLNHPHILPFYGTCEDNNRIYMVSHFCGKGNIREYARGMDFQDKLWIIEKIASALQYLHSLNPPIVHGDVKPQNTLIDDEGWPYLADFGMAKLAAVTYSDLRNAGSVRFMAPELFVNDNSSGRTIHSDVWAFGMFILELMTDQVPFSDLPDPRVTVAVLTGKRPSQPPSVPDPLWSLCLACWVTNPTDRPSMDQIITQVCDMAQPAPTKTGFIRNIRLARPLSRTQQRNNENNEATRVAANRVRQTVIAWFSFQVLIDTYDVMEGSLPSVRLMPFSITWIDRLITEMTSLVVIYGLIIWLVLEVLQWTPFADYTQFIPESFSARSNSLGLLAKLDKGLHRTRQLFFGTFVFDYMVNMGFTSAPSTTSGSFLWDSFRALLPTCFSAILAWVIGTVLARFWDL